MRYSKKKYQQLQLEQIDEPQNLDINELKNVWRNANIQEHHQAIILQYFNMLPHSILDEQIAYQLKLTKNNSSFLCSIKNLERNRLSILQHLCSQINLFEQAKIKNEKNFTLICQTVGKLRSANLIFAEALLNIHKYYIDKIPERHAFIQLASFFQALHNDNLKLKKSFLRKYIVFSQSYDPFFLKHYELLKRSDNPRLREKPAIQALFSIAINDVYRLTKAQEQIKEYLSKNVNNEDYLSIINKFDKTITPNLRMSDRLVTEPLKHKKLVNKIYLKNSNIKNDNFSPLSNKNTTDQQTNFSYVNPKYINYQDISYIGKSKRLPSINRGESHNKYKIQKPESSIQSNDYFKDNPLSRRRSYHQRVNLVEKRQQQFKKMVFPKQFSDKWKGKQSPDYWRNQRKNTYTTPHDRIQVSKCFFSDRGDSNSSSSRQKRHVQTQCQQQTQNEEIYTPKVLKKIIQASIQSNKLLETIKTQNQEIAVQADIPEIQLKVEQPQPQKETVLKRRKSSFKKQEAVPISKKQAIQNSVSNQQKVKTTKPSSIINKNTLNKQKKYKLKAADKAMTIQKIFQVLKQLNINPVYRAHFQVGNWQKAIQNNQYYFHKSFIDDQLQAISLCCALPQGDITIKYWGPMTTCDEQLSYFLFSKYLQHLQKQTQLKKIYFNANSIKELTNNNFILLRERIFERERIISETISQSEYTYFLSVNFTNIAINKATPDSNSLIVQQGIKQFEAHKFIIFNYLLIISKLITPGSFASVASYTSKVKSIQKCNQILLSNYISTNAYNSVFKSQYFNLLTFKLRTTVFSPYFIADRGYIKIIGDVVYDTDEAFIVCLPMHKYATKLYFGKGMKNAPQMIQKMREGQKINHIRRVVFSIRMFKKKLRGKIIAINLKQEHCFGDLEISFVWKDYLKGKIVHPMADCQEVFDDQFYCLLEMEREVMFVFEVLPENFVEM